MGQHAIGFELRRGRWAAVKILSAGLAALVLATTEAAAQQPSAESPDAVAARNAYARRKAELQRRRDAEARLDGFLKNPPDTAPRWLQRKAADAKSNGRAK